MEGSRKSIEWSQKIKLLKKDAGSLIKVIKRSVRGGAILKTRITPIIHMVRGTVHMWL